MALYELVDEPDPAPRPLVVCLEGWIDAGVGAAGAAASLLATYETRLVARFDGDELIDHRARRPVLRITDGVFQHLTWPVPELRVGVGPDGTEVLLLTGPEPDSRWHQFCAETAQLVADLGASTMVGLGAFPAPVPHTRPVRLAITASNQMLADKIGYIGGSIDVPCGVQAALEVEVAGLGLESCTLWARVPHYISNIAYPAASVALLEGLHDLTGIGVDTTALQASAEATAARLSSLIGGSDEHGAMLEQLEAQYDAETGTPRRGPSEQHPSAGGGRELREEDLPSGDELAAELQRFLRGE